MNTAGENLKIPRNVGTRDPGSIVGSPNLRNFLGLCLFGTAYYFAYYYGMFFSQTAASPFWFPDSVLLCALLVTRSRHWSIFFPVMLVIRLLVPLNADIPMWFKLATFAIDAAKGLLVAVALRRFIRDPLRLQTIQDYAIYCLFAVLLVPAANGFAGAWARQSFGFHYWTAWRQWFMGDALTHLIVTPALLFLVSGGWKDRPPSSRGQRLEGGLLVVGLVATGWIAFHTGSVRIGLDETSFYAPIPFLFWAAIRFGMFGASGAITIIAFLAVEAAVSGQGLFTGLSPDETAQSLQNFLLLRAAPLYLVAILVEQKKSDERSLRESEALNRGIIDSLTSLVAILDRSGRIIAVNDAWRKFHQLGGIPPPGIDVGVDYLEVCRRAESEGDPSSAEILAAIEDVLSGKETEFQSEYSCVTPAGALWFEILVTPLRSEAGGAVVKHRDITDRKQAEAETRELRDELSHAGRVTLLGQLSSSLAHELNQPLAAILRNAEAAEIFLQNDLPDLDELRAIVADIRKDDQRAGGVIDRLRALLQRGQLDLRSLPLGDVIEEVVTLTRADSATRHVSIEIDVPNELPLIRGDRIHLQQVLLNLLINGMDALAEGADGSRTIAVHAQKESDGFVEVAVRDNGPGIAAEKLSRLFEPFFTTKPQGMGIGLPISETIIKAHGGKLWAENNAEGGATFHFTVPIAKGDAA